MTFASLVTFIQVVFFATIFLLFISGTVGWMLIYAFLLAVAASIILTVISRNHYTVEVEPYSGVTEVGGKCTVKVTVRKKGLCIIPYLTLEGYFSGGSFTVKTSLLLSRSAEVTLTLSPSECGLQKATIFRGYAEDFLWILRLKKNMSIASDIAVLPRMVDYNGPEVIPSLLPSESEEHEEGITVAFGGAPGYEHREYARGDSPRRINYKLSAKKQKLMVRLDESTGTECTNIVLPSNADGACAEQAYALAYKLVMSGSPAAVYHGSDSFETTSPQTLPRLREWLAFRDLAASPETRYPSGMVRVTISPEQITVNN